MVIPTGIVLNGNRLNNLIQKTVCINVGIAYSWAVNLHEIHGTKTFWLNSLLNLRPVPHKMIREILPQLRLVLTIEILNWINCPLRLFTLNNLAINSLSNLNRKNRPKLGHWVALVWDSDISVSTNLTEIKQLNLIANVNILTVDLR